MPYKNHWSSSIWFVAHTMASAFPQSPSDAHKKAAKQFIHSLVKLMPCASCGEHLEEDLRSYPVKCENREEFERYVYDLHNRVNIKLSKPINYSFEEIQAAFCPYKLWMDIPGYPSIYQVAEKRIEQVLPPSTNHTVANSAAPAALETKELPTVSNIQPSVPRTSRTLAKNTRLCKKEKSKKNRTKLTIIICVTMICLLSGIIGISFYTYRNLERRRALLAY